MMAYVYHDELSVRVVPKRLHARARAYAYALNFHVMKSLFSKTCQVYIHSVYSPKMLCIYKRTHIPTHTHIHKTPTAATHRNKSCCHLINSARARARAMRYLFCMCHGCWSYLCVFNFLTVVCCVSSQLMHATQTQTRRTLEQISTNNLVYVLSAMFFLREFRIVLAGTNGNCIRLTLDTMLHGKSTHATHTPEVEQVDSTTNEREMTTTMVERRTRRAPRVRPHTTLSIDDDTRKITENDDPSTPSVRMRGALVVVVVMLLPRVASARRYGKSFNCGVLVPNYVLNAHQSAQDARWRVGQ